MTISQDVVEILEYLLPGFLAAWVFYILTGHPKQSPFERTVQALILTIVIKASVYVINGTAVLTGSHLFSVGKWDDSTAVLWSVIVAFIVGHALAWAANNNAYHKCLYRFNITSKTSLVSEWHSAFTSTYCYVILHLADDLDNRRLFGWPEEWPDDPVNGHFVINEPEWLAVENGEYKRIPLPQNELLMVGGRHVVMVEFVRTPGTPHNEDENERKEEIGTMD